MKILMMTNTYLPHVGGVARSVDTCAGWLRNHGHDVLIAAPTFEGASKNEPYVTRVSAIQHFNGTDFSVPLPLTAQLHRTIDRFRPDLVHSHHPFLLGDTALRVSAEFDIPIVFTHHTMYEHFTHYAPLDSPRMKRFATELSTGYADLCDAVIAPSKTIAEILRERGVHTPIHVLPTGVDLDRFASGDGARFRRAEKIPADSIIVGHVGRLATEKNLDFLVHCLVEHARGNPRIHVVIVGDGPESSAIDAQFQNAGLSHRLHLTGTLAARQLADVYRSMNVFAFASRVETQGLVLAEAMAAHVPVVAIDAPAVRDVVRDRSNGRLVVGEETSSFVEALDWATSPENCPGLEIGTATTAKSYSIETTGRKLANLYKSLERRVARPAYSHTESVWSVARRRLHKEWLLAVHRGHALHDTWRAPESNP